MDRGRDYNPFLLRQDMISLARLGKHITPSRHRIVEGL